MSESTNGGRANDYHALRESEELHRATLSNISDAVFLLDDEGAFKYICPNVNVIFAYVPDEVQAMGRISALLGEDLFDRAELFARGELPDIEREVVSKSGQRRIVLIHLKQVAIKGGTILCMCRDITALRQAERELAAARVELTHAARMVLAGELTASIMHEIRQPLTAIFANASAGRMLTEDPTRHPSLSELGEILSDIQRDSANAAEIIERLRRLACKRPLELKVLDVNEIATDVLRLVAGDAYRRHVTLRAELNSAPLHINADRVSLQQVIVNLIANAMDAVDGGKDGQERQVIVRSREASGAVEISVSDTGHGILGENFSRLFETFFTTKKEGIGLGLAIARSIVEAHAGRIWAENHDSGATFRLLLPLRPEPMQQRAADGG